MAVKINAIMRVDEVLHYFFYNNNRVKEMRWDPKGNFNPGWDKSLAEFTHGQLTEEFNDGLDTVMRVNNQQHYFIKGDTVNLLFFEGHQFRFNKKMTVEQWTGGALRARTSV